MIQTDIGSVWFAQGRRGKERKGEKTELPGCL